MTPAVDSYDNKNGMTRTAKSDGISINVGDKTRDKCVELIYDALSLDSGSRESINDEPDTVIYFLPYI